MGNFLNKEEEIQVAASALYVALYEFQIKQEPSVQGMIYDALAKKYEDLFEEPFDISLEECDIFYRLFIRYYNGAWGQLKAGNEELLAFSKEVVEQAEDQAKGSTIEFVTRLYEDGKKHHQLFPELEEEETYSWFFTHSLSRNHVLYLAMQGSFRLAANDYFEKGVRDGQAWASQQLANMRRFYEEIVEKSYSFAQLALKIPYGVSEERRASLITLFSNLFSHLYTEIVQLLFYNKEDIRDQFFTYYREYNEADASTAMALWLVNHLSGEAASIAIQPIIENERPKSLIKDLDDMTIAVISAWYVSLDHWREKVPFSKPDQLEDMIPSMYLALYGKAYNPDEEASQDFAQMFLFVYYATAKHLSSNNEEVLYLASLLKDYGIHEGFPILTDIYNAWHRNGIFQRLYPLTSPQKESSEDPDRWSEEKAACTVPGCMAGPIHKVASITIPFSSKEKPAATVLYSCPEHREETLKELENDRLIRYVAYLAEKLGKMPTGKPTIEVFGDPNHFPLENRIYPEKVPLLIERFRLRQRWEPGTTMRKEVLKRYGEKGVAFCDVVCDAIVDLAKKFRFDSGAADLLQRLSFPDVKSCIEKMRAYSQYVWIEFEEPIETPYGTIHAFSYAQNGQASVDYAQKKYPLPKKQFQEMSALFHGSDPTYSQYVAGIDASNEYGEAIWTIMIAEDEKRAGSTSPYYIEQKEPYITCGRAGCLEHMRICDECMEKIHIFLSLYVRALSIIQGEVRQREEQEDIHPVRTIETKRREPDPNKPHKKREQQVKHQMTLVTFNALAHPKEQQKDTSPGQKRGSWKSKLDPEQIVYVKHVIELKDGRTLRHPRYHNYIKQHGGNPDDPNGFKIEVKTHEHWYPVRIENLQYTMAYVTTQPKKKARKNDDTVGR